MHKPAKNTLLRAKKIQDLTALHYEPGRHDRCKKWVYRNIVIKTYPMSERTFFRLLSTDLHDLNPPDPEDKQTKLDF